VKRRIPTVRGIRAILRKAGVPLSEYKSEKKYGPRYLTEGADIYALRTRDDVPVRVQWYDGRWTTVKLPEPVRAALDAAGYVTDAQGLVLYKETL